MTDIADSDPKSLILVVADMARSDPPMTTSFVSELARRLQGQSPALALPLTWIEQRLAESNRTIEQLVQSGNQQQAADQLSISNSIGSLRMLGAIDWREFAESNSVIERTLRQDPDGVYGRMDFATRDRYRHAVELVDWVVQMIVAPHPLPRMDFSAGIPSVSHTLVVVPTMPTAAADIEDLAEALEVRFLANRDRNLHFGLLTDFTDADQEMLPQDASLLELACRSIEELNAKYGDAAGGGADDAPAAAL